MCSYNAVNGVPSCANGKFLNGVVRQQWGWDGMVVSDCGAIGDIMSPHQYTKTPDDTVAAALKGGTDLECDNIYQMHAAAALADGKITIDDVDQAISRTLTHFVALGELEGPDEVPYQVTPAALTSHNTSILQYLTRHTGPRWWTPPSTGSCPCPWQSKR